MIFQLEDAAILTRSFVIGSSQISKNPSHDLTLLLLPTIVNKQYVNQDMIQVRSYDSCASHHEQKNKMWIRHVEKMNS